MPLGHILASNLNVFNNLSTTNQTLFLLKKLETIQNPYIPRTQHLYLADARKHLANESQHYLAPQHMAAAQPRHERR
jgi:hypothetical protein